MRPHAASTLCAVLAALAPSTGCVTHRYVYEPEQAATALVAGRSASYYRIPPQAPHGDVRVATLGLVKITPQGGRGREVHAMHVRMVVDNNDDAGPWLIDTRQETASLEGYGKSRPAFASSTLGHPPVVSVPPGESATIDLYYPLPQNLQKASEIPQFAVLWHVQTPEGAVAERTSFERVNIEPAPPPPSLAWEMGWWGPGWYDPFWPDDAFWGAPAFVFVGTPYRVVAPPPPSPPPARRIR
jgi:hypothetical protein